LTPGAILQNRRRDVADLELILISLLIAVAVLSALARAVDIPYPIVLVAGGLAMGFIPGLPRVELDPDLVLLVFLPPLLYSGAFFADLRSLRSDLRSISMLAIGLVLATTVVVAVIAHEVVDGLPWAAAFTLGAIVAPTDPVAATTIARRLAVPRRIVNSLEGESLLNDGTALVAYRTAVVAVGGTFSLLDASWEFVRTASGGVLVGLAVGWVIIQVRRRIDDALIETTISLLSGYAGYVAAEQIGCSGVLAAVTVGIYVGWQAPRIASPSQRLTGFAVWEMLLFLLNALLFVLIGLQLPFVLEGLSDESSATLLGQAVLVSVVVTGTRIVWLNTTPYLIRLLDRRPSQRARRVGWRPRMISAWSGMRGAVSLAAALALPLDFPQRDLIVFLTFAVILFTLVIQGLTLPAVIRRLGVEDDDAEEREELRARRAAVEAALSKLEELEAEDWTRNDTAERMRGMYRYRRRRLAARDGVGESLEDRSVVYQTMVREVIEAQRRAIVALRNSGEISNDVMHRLERELDLEDQRLEI
jgi:CPA1 family monovalent cation:H+ antiporter